MRECAEDLSPDYAEVAHVTTTELGEDTVEDVAKHMHT